MYVYVGLIASMLIKAHMGIHVVHPHVVFMSTSDLV